MSVNNSKAAQNQTGSLGENTLRRPKSGSMSKREQFSQSTNGNFATLSGNSTPRKQSTASKLDDEFGSANKSSKENDLGNGVRRNCGANGRITSNINSNISARGIFNHITYFCLL